MTSTMKPNLEGASITAYQPAQVSQAKYEKIVEGRNRFFMTTIGCVALFLGVSAIPQLLIHRSVRHLYRKYARGKVLDLSPKLYDEKDVALYEMSKAVRVEFLVDKKVVDDGSYRINEGLSEAEQEERRRSMTLNFMIRNDHNWVGSTVSFATILKSSTELPGFTKYDTIVVRDELLNCNTVKAQQIFESAARLMSDDGTFLVMDFGKSRYSRLNNVARWFNKRTNSSMCITHDYHNWIRESLLYDVKEERRCLLGFYYAMALQLRK